MQKRKFEGGFIYLIQRFAHLRPSRDNDKNILKGILENLNAVRDIISSILIKN